MKSTPSWKKSTPWTHDHASLAVRRDLIPQPGHFLVLLRQLSCPPQAVLLLVLVFLVLIHESSCGSTAGTSTGIMNDIKEATWQNCDVFMAPTNTTTGWGVFAARDFEYQELVDIPPLYLPFDKTEEETADTFSLHRRLIEKSALEGYVYTVYRNHIARNQSNVMFGYDMIYNHHPTDPNVIICMGGPAYSQGFCARRKIRAGEQLLSRYGFDGGTYWFEVRKLTMQADKFNIDSLDKLEFLKTQYCTKIYAGPGPSTFRQLVPSLDTSRIAPFDAGLFDARAKVPIKAGDRIEQGPAMLLYKPFVDDTVLGPLVISWDDLLTQHQDTLRAASKSWGEKLPIHYRGEATQWKRIQRFASIEKVALLPFAGRIGLVRRVHNRQTEQQGLKQTTSFSTTGTSGDSSNCRLEINVDVQGSEGEAVPEVSVVLTLVATEDIEVGQVLKMDLKPAGTAYEKELLKLKLSETGHLYALTAS